MAGGHFEIRCTPLTETTFTPHGREQIDYFVSANPGQPLQPLNKVASGGELSRIGLAINVMTAQKYQTPLLVIEARQAAIVKRVRFRMTDHSLIIYGVCEQCDAHQD